MKSPFSVLLAIAFASAPLLFGDPAPQPPLSFTAGPPGTWNVDWAGVSARTYFLQGSQDFVSWDYAPMVEFGTGVKSFGMATGNAQRYFVRLQYRDDPRVTNLEEAYEADFDLDGMPNHFEIIHGFDPTKATGDDGAANDSDGDGFGNLAEYQFGSGPKDPAGRPVGKISASAYHSVALTADGRVWSWGYNGLGQLGDGTTTNRSSPVPLSGVPGMSRIVEIGTGGYYTFALDDQGVLWGWGANSSRQISKDSTFSFLKPVKIDLPGPVSRFACGNHHALALGRDGKIWGWGASYNGQLGQAHNNPVTGFVEIVRPVGMQHVKALAAGDDNSYAVDVAGKMWAWGYNFYSELGDGSNTDRHAPVPVDVSNGVPAIRSIVTGENHTLASGTDGSIWSWGLGIYGQLGHGSSTYSNKPVKVTTGLAAANALAAGDRHSLAVSPSGVVWAWGGNGRGQLGNNSTTSSNTPVQTSPVTGWLDILRIAGGDDHNVALKTDGSVWSWGNNDYGKLGLGDPTQRNEPVRLLNLKLAGDESDLDGVPDSFERFHFAGSLAFSGNHVAVVGGASIAQAYTYRLNPNVADNDDDGIKDAAEIAVGLDPLDWSDGSGDLDGDRIPNLWEQEMGSDMANGLSTPGSAANIVITVSPGQSIQSAINAVPASSSNPTWAIIRVQPGVYTGNLIVPPSKRILLVSTGSGGIPEIRGTQNNQTTIGIFAESVIDGFRITREKGFTGHGVQTSSSNGRELVRIVNCMIHGNDGASGAGILANQGRTVIAHCTIINNKAASGSPVDLGTGKLILQNSIVWNPANPAAPQIGISLSGSATTTNSIILGGQFGGNPVEPLTDRYHCLLPGSPAIGAGTPLPVSLDVHGEPRPSLAPDIGADQRVDIESDFLPDWWEISRFGNLAKSGTNDDDTPTPDRLTARYEYLLGFDPANPDTLGNGSGDLFNAVFTSSADPWYPAEWRLDGDADGLSNGQELYYGTSPSNSDTNSDGVPDKTAIQSGISATSLDTDGDGVLNAQEIINGTSPFLVDSDGDGVADNLDAFPLDPSRRDAPAGTPGDVTAPQILLITPENATPF